MICAQDGYNSFFGFEDDPSLADILFHQFFVYDRLLEVATANVLKMILSISV